MVSTDYLKSVFKLSIVGVFLGTLFLSVSLAPSLLPRPPAVQGILAGVSFTVGYGVGVAGLALWKFLQLPQLQPRVTRLLTLSATALCTVIAISFLWQASSWQNSLRAMMGMEESMGLQPLSVGPVALLVFAALLTLGRLFRRVFHLPVAADGAPCATTHFAHRGCFHLGFAVLVGG